MNETNLSFDVMVRSPTVKLCTFKSYLNKKNNNNDNQIKVGFIHNDNYIESQVITQIFQIEPSNLHFICS